MTPASRTAANSAIAILTDQLDPRPRGGPDRAQPFANVSRYLGAIDEPAAEGPAKDRHCLGGQRPALQVGLLPKTRVQLVGDVPDHEGLRHDIGMISLTLPGIL